MPIVGLGLLIPIALVVFWFLSGIRIVNEYEQGVVLRLGRFAGIRSAGLKWIIPFIDRMIIIDMRVIPVNVGAVILLLAGVGLLVAEGYVTAHGIAGVGGAVCIVLGTAFFIDRASPDYQFDPGAFTVSPWIVWPTPVALALVLGYMAWKIAGARRAPLKLGAPGLVGSAGEALTDIGPGGGEAFVHGEYWRAESALPIPRGARVRVTAVSGLVVSVVADEARTG